MDFEKLWHQILLIANEAAFDVATGPQNNRIPLWFNIYTLITQQIIAPLFD